MPQRLLILLAASIVAGGALALLFGGGSGYHLRLEFLNASQLVAGGAVEVGGSQAGVIDSMNITPNGLAEADVSIDPAFAPLRVGTRAVIRLPSEVGITNRYVDLIPPPGSGGPRLPNNAVLNPSQTTTAVDFDQVLSIFDARSRKAFQAYTQNSNRQLADAAPEQAKAFEYLEPYLNTSTLLERQMAQDRPLLEQFVADTDRLVTALASRREPLADEVGQLNRVFTGLSSNASALTTSLTALPPFLRHGEKTLTRVRGLLRAFSPVVNASIPATRALTPYLEELKPVATELEPVLSELNDDIERPGPHNDLIDLTRAYVPLAHEALDTLVRTGRRRPGALIALTRSATGDVPVTAFWRPYSSDLWASLADAYRVNIYDALGGMARSEFYTDALTPSPSPSAIPLAQRGVDLLSELKTGQYRRCPGGAEVIAPDHSNLLSPGMRGHLGCLESGRAAH